MTEPHEGKKGATRVGAAVLDLGGLSGISEENARSRFEDEGPN